MYNILCEHTSRKSICREIGGYNKKITIKLIIAYQRCMSNTCNKMRNLSATMHFLTMYVI